MTDEQQSGRNGSHTNSVLSIFIGSPILGERAQEATTRNHLATQVLDDSSCYV